MRGLLEWAEPQLGQLEGQYRQHYLKADIAQAQIFALVVILASLAFIPLDIGLLRGQPATLALTLALRAVMLATGAGFALLLRRTSTPAHYDRLVFGYTILVALEQGLSATTRPASYYGTSTFDIILILYYYLVVPNRLGYRAASALAMSAVSLATLFLTRERSLLYWTSVPIAIVGVHLIGLTSSIRSYTYRRHEYQAIEQARVLNQRLTVLAEIDSLTGAYNRRKFIELGAEEFSRYQRYGHSFALVLADVDWFKRINDQHGHAAGDKVLAAVAGVMLAGKRTNDALGRLGGEEFALLLPETTHAAALVVAERIRQQVQAAAIPIDQGTISVTFSAGVVAVEPGDAEFDAALRRADQLLYRAKERGRNRVEA
jgi:diguanylate cyclase (GGDEF)-like protein